MTESISYLFQSLVIPKLFARAIEAIKGVDSSTYLECRVPSVNTLLRKWFEAERVVSKWLPFGPR